MVVNQWKNVKNLSAYESLRMYAFVYQSFVSRQAPDLIDGEYAGMHHLFVLTDQRGRWTQNNENLFL